MRPLQLWRKWGGEAAQVGKEMMHDHDYSRRVVKGSVGSAQECRQQLSSWRAPEAFNLLLSAAQRLDPVSLPHFEAPDLTIYSSVPMF